MECGGSRFMTWARRIAERDLDCFLLGTAMDHPRFGCAGFSPIGAKGPSNFDAFTPASREPTSAGNAASHLQLSEREAQLRRGGLSAGRARARHLVPVAATDRAKTRAVLAAKGADRDREENLLPQLGGKV